MRVLLLTLSTLGCAQAADLQLEANWAVERQWSDPDAAQTWISESDWHPSLNTELSLQQGGFEVAAQVTDDKVELTQLYQDISTPHAEWTVGLKSQQWAYAHSSDQLNWLENATVLLREQYFSTVTVQTFCQFDAQSTAGCGLRTSGWLGNLDWQWMTRHVRDWQVAGALQIQVGLGGLMYLEGQYEANARWTALNYLSSMDSYTADDTQGTEWSGTAGLQWTLPAKLTLNYETNVRSRHLHQEDWHRISTQLTTASATLVAPFVREHLPANQHLIRLSWLLDSFELEQTVVVWPAAETWLSRTRIQQELTPELSLETSVDVPAPDGLFSTIGAGPSVKMQLSYRDGIGIGP